MLGVRPSIPLSITVELDITNKLSSREQTPD
jgi:hypothetical protein